MLTEFPHLLRDLELTKVARVFLKQQVVHVVIQALACRVFLMNTRKEIVDVVVDHLLDQTVRGIDSINVAQVILFSGAPQCFLEIDQE